MASRYSKSGDAAWKVRNYLLGFIAADVGLAVLERHHFKAWGLLALIAIAAGALASALGAYHDSQYKLDEYHYNMTAFGNNPVSTRRIRHIMRSRS